jgi:nicotinate-nucleotide adenylyltransferase
MRRLCFGGSFNPIHWGHLRCAQAVASRAGYEQVVLIPAAVSPHKVAGELATADDRLAMCRLAIAELEQHKACHGNLGNLTFDVNDIELRRSPPSYTIETIRALKRAGWSEVHWLIGGDQVASLPKWHEPEAILREATLLIMARPGFTIDWRSLPPAFGHLAGNVVEAPLIDISATDIRRRVRNRLPIAGLVPDSVAGYIHARGLYVAGGE